MKFYTQTPNVLKALYSSVQHEVNWWTYPKINVVLSNGLNTPFVDCLS